MRGKTTPFCCCLELCPFPDELTKSSNPASEQHIPRQSAASWGLVTCRFERSPMHQTRGWASKEWGFICSPDLAQGSFLMLPTVMVLWETPRLSTCLVDCGTAQWSCRILNYFRDNKVFCFLFGCFGPHLGYQSPSAGSPALLSGQQSLGVSGNWWPGQLPLLQPTSIWCELGVWCFQTDTSHFLPACRHIDRFQWLVESDSPKQFHVGKTLGKPRLLTEVVVGFWIQFVDSWCRVNW